MKKTLITSVCMLITILFSHAQTITDIDGNIYTSVIIGGQEWLQQNLRTKRFNNGDSIPEVDFSDNHCGETSPKYRASYGWSVYGDTTYGQLYTWFAANDSRGVCPSGYGMPSRANWDTLINYLGAPVAAGHLKEAGTSHWVVASAGADNNTGFTALPGGHFLAGGFNSLTTEAHFWTSSEQAPGFGQDLWFRASYDNVTQEFSQSCFGYSVRCIKNNSTGINEEKSSPQLKIYPNPAHETVSIQWDVIQPVVTGIMIYNINGEEVNCSANSDFNVIDISHLVPGEYFIHILTPGKNYLEKIIVQ